MGKFLDTIRNKLGLEPERKTTVTGRIPSEVIINRNVMKEFAGYPYPVIPAPGLVDAKARYVGDDQKLDSQDQEIQNNLRRRRAQRRKKYAIDEDMADPMVNYGPTSPDSIRPSAFVATTTPIPSKRKMKNEAMFAADIASGDTGEAGNPNQPMDQLSGPTHPVDPVIRKKKTVREDSQKEIDPDEDEPCSGLKRGTRVHIKKDGYNSKGNVDFYDPSSKKYMIALDRGSNLVVDADDVEQLKDKEMKEEVSLREHVQSIISEAKKYYTVPTDTPIILGRNHPDPKARELSKKWHEIQREMNRNAGMSNTQLKNNPNAPYEYARLAGEADHHQKEFNKRMQELKGLSESKGRGADSKGLYRPTEQGAGLTRKGAKHYGVKTAVTTPPSKLDPKGKAAKRRKSFCARMSGMPGPMKDEKGRPTRKAMSLRRWNCEANEVLMSLVEAKKMKGDPCWKDYEMVGTKQKNGREVPNCVPKG